jgi:hypothetical protein
VLDLKNVFTQSVSPGAKLNKRLTEGFKAHLS